MPMSTKIRQIAPRRDLRLVIAEVCGLSLQHAEGAHWWCFAGWIEVHMPASEHTVNCNCRVAGGPALQFDPMDEAQTMTFLKVKRAMIYFQGKRSLHELTIHAGECGECGRMHWMISRAKSQQRSQAQADCLW